MSPRFQEPSKDLAATVGRRTDDVTAVAAGDRSLLLQLLDLAYDAASYLRHSSRAVVRVSAALLLAGSMAACFDGSESEEELSPAPVVQPLSQEVLSGLPRRPGRYPVQADSVGRDQQGVYHFAWRESGQEATQRNQASASRLRLLEAGEDVLEVPDQGDPILRLRGETPISLVATVDDLRSPTPQAGTTRSGIYTPWYPFYLMNTRYPTYYEPPTRTVVQGEPVRGAAIQQSPVPLAQRTITLPGAVSGRAGGAGSGTAATQRTGVTGGKSASVSSPKSSGFSSGSKSVSGGSSS